ncbi:MAG: hypothetical protein LBG47_10155 [Prevotellaceae bacterium]|nr:hypothetical protein [Prevotellaceae bacterium]
MFASLSGRKKQQASSGEDMLLWVQQPDIPLLSFPKALLLLTQVAPYLNLMLLAFAVYSPPFYIALLLFLAPQWAVQRRYSKRVQRAKSRLNAIINDAAAFDIYGDALSGVAFRSSWLQHIQQPIAGYNRLMRQLHKMLSVFDMSNSFMGALISSFYFGDLRVAVKLERWKKTNRDALPKLIEHVCEWELLTSVAVFAMNHPTFAFPKFFEEDSSTIVEAKALGHPLIAAEKRVCNDIVIRKNDFFIITGANMAGKSAFLRTVGVNLLLARIGAPVCAASFRCSPVELFTSMRTTDNLNAEVSYFYAEALRLKEMLNFIASGKHVLLMVDELFRGTNSDDRLKASLSLIRKLLCYKTASALIATHDFELATLEEEYPGAVKNYCFECFNHDDKILFDYRLRRGVSCSSNAYLLLQKMGIVE